MPSVRMNPPFYQQVEAEAVKRPNITTNSKILHGNVGFDATQAYLSGGGRCPDGCGEVMIVALMPGLVEYTNQNGTHDAHKFGTTFCAGCGVVSGQTQQCIARVVQATPVAVKQQLANTLFARAGVQSIAKQTVSPQFPILRKRRESTDSWAIAGKFYATNVRGGEVWYVGEDAREHHTRHEDVDKFWFPIEQSVSAPQKRLCECGAWAVGAADNTPVHQNSNLWTCPAYGSPFKEHKETQEELVARVRAGKRAAGQTQGSTP